MADLTIGLVTGSPAYGGIEQLVPVAISDIDDTPQVIAVDSGAVTIPQNFTQDLPNNGVRFGKSGIWSLSMSLSLVFTDLNAGRTFNLELYNETRDLVVTSGIIPVGRNTSGATSSPTLLLEVGEGFVGELFQVRLVSAADTFESVELNFFALSAIRIDSLRTS